MNKEQRTKVIGIKSKRRIDLLIMDKKCSFYL